MMNNRAGCKWLPEEDEYLINAYGNTSMERIAKHLNRSVGAIVNRKVRLGLGNFLDNGDRKNYINKNQLVLAVCGGSGSSSYKNISWIKNRSLPTHKIKRLNSTFEVIYIGEFWEWAERNKNFLDFSKFQKFALGPEPEWVEEKRRRDRQHAQQYKTTPWTEVEDQRLLHLLRQYKYTYMDLSKILNRTNGAIQRRICDLGLKERPIKADNHRKWSDEEWQALGEMIKAGYKYEEMEAVIGRSSKAIRGRVFDMYLTECLDKVREYIGDGQWGDNVPQRPIRYMRLMSDDEKEQVRSNLSLLAGIVRTYAADESGQRDKFIDYFQKDMCMKWDDVLGCTAGENCCDSCGSFERILPQYCVRCGGTFFERKINNYCSRCRTQRKKQAQRKFAVLRAKYKK